MSGSTEPLEKIVEGNRASPAGGRWRRVASQARREDARIARLLVASAVVITVALVLYPLVLGFKSSLEAGGAATGTPTHFVGLRNYGDVLKDPEARSAVLHTLRYVALALVLEITLGVAIAVVLHRVFRGRGIVLAVLILPWALPSVVSGVLWRRVFDPDSGLLNSALMHLHIINHPIVWLASNVWALTFITLVHVWGVLPLVSLIFLAGLQSIPEEVYSASAVDGASSLRQFWHITLPLLRPSMAVALTVGTILGIGIFDEIFVLNGTAQNTRSILMQVYNTTFANADFAHGTALAFLLAAVTALFALVFVLVNRRSTT
ncbi:MAG: sugar ABC transporter permease [Actinomycetota bacterium]|nr:sugar ABC transporter permease [Actinomycetota bacterium]